MGIRSDMAFSEFARHYLAGTWYWVSAMLVGWLLLGLIAVSDEMVVARNRQYDWQMAQVIAHRLSRVQNHEEVLDALGAPVGIEWMFERNKLTRKRLDDFAPSQIDKMRRVLDGTIEPEPQVPSILEEFAQLTLTEGPITLWWMVTLVGFYLFVQRSRKRAEYLADLPWKKWWPWCLACVAPMSVPFLIVSAVRWRAATQRARRTEEEGERERCRGAHVSPKKKLDVQLLKQWLALRQQYRREALDAQMKAEEVTVTAASAKLQELSEEMGKQHQAQRGARRRVNELRSVEFPSSVTPEETQRFTDEFRGLCSMSLVASVTFGHETLSVFTKPIIVAIAGTWYDLGDWMIELRTKLGSTDKRVVPTRIARKDGMGSHPYSTDWERGQICYGLDINEQLVELQRRGEYLPVVSIIIERLGIYNPGHEELIERKYVRLPEAVALTLLKERKAAEQAAKEAS